MKKKPVLWIIVLIILFLIFVCVVGVLYLGGPVVGSTFPTVIAGIPTEPAISNKIDAHISNGTLYPPKFNVPASRSITITITSTDSFKHQCSVNSTPTLKFTVTGTTTSPSTLTISQGLPSGSYILQCDLPNHSTIKSYIQAR